MTFIKSRLPAPPAKTVVLITGASSGIGRACVEYLNARGFRVYGAGRRFPAKKITPSRRVTNSDGYRVVRMDVRNSNSVNQAIALIIKAEGRIDVLVNGAGSGIAAAVEDSSITDVKKQFEVNFFGILRVCRAVLPAMRARRYGRIINISSLAGLAGQPFQGAYSASKFAVEGLSESMRLELMPHGIQVSLIEPGDIRTAFTDNRVITAAAKANSAYAATFKRVLAKIEHAERHAPHPQCVARLLDRIISAPRPLPRYTVGLPLQRAIALGKHMLPARLYEKMVTTHYRMDCP